MRKVKATSKHSGTLHTAHCNTHLFIIIFIFVIAAVCYSFGSYEWKQKLRFSTMYNCKWIFVRCLLFTVLTVRRASVSVGCCWRKRIEHPDSFLLLHLLARFSLFRFVYFRSFDGEIVAVCRLPFGCQCFNIHESIMQSTKCCNALI